MKKKRRAYLFSLANQEKVLVTGGDGFIGRHFLKKLRKVKKKEFVFDGFNVSDWSKVMALPPATVVVHLAAQVSVPLSLEKPEETYQVNNNGLFNLLEYCRRHQAGMIFPSTALVYGRPQYLPIDEEHPLTTTINPYVKSKIWGEALCRLYNQIFGVPVLIFRFFNVYGPGQSKGAVVPQMMADLFQKGVITINDGEVGRDFVYVADVVEALWLALNQKDKNLQLINIGSGQSTQIRQLAEMIRKTTGIKGKMVERKQKRPEEAKEVRAKIEKAKRCLNWQPKTSLKEGILKTYKDFLKR